MDLLSVFFCFVVSDLFVVAVDFNMLVFIGVLTSEGINWAVVFDPAFKLRATQSQNVPKVCSFELPTVALWLKHLVHNLSTHLMTTVGQVSSHHGNP